MGIFPKGAQETSRHQEIRWCLPSSIQDLCLTPPQEHALRTCSILAIPPPPPGQEALPGGVPEDLSQDNLSTWAETVQDVVAGMIAPRPEMSLTIFPQVVEVLTILESVSWVTFCRQCYLAESTCRCLGGSFTTSTASTAGQSWSEIADPTFGPNSASAGGGAGSAPPYGSPAMAGGSIWDPPHADYPRLPGAPTAIRQPCPPAGRASHLESKLTAIRYGRTAPPDPLRLPRPTSGPPTMQPHRPVQPPTPPPRTDSALTSDQSQQTTAADMEQEGQETRRPGRARARGRAHKDKPASAVPHRPRTSQPAQGRSGGASQSEQQRAPDWNPLAKLSTHRSGGWKKDLDCYMGAYFWLNYRHEPASKWPELKAKFFEFLIDHHSEWKSIRNNDPLEYLPYMEAQFERVTGYKLVGLGACMEWIRAGSYYHWAIAQQGQLGRCPRLASVPPPQGPMTPPPYPPVTVAASTQATIPDPPWGGGGQPRAESQP